MTKTTKSGISDNKLTKLINDHLSNLPKIGDIVKGRLIKANKHDILIDIDGFATGIIRGHEIKNLPEEFQKLKENDEIEAMVIDLENENGQMELSLKSALVEGAWQFIKEKEQNQEIIDVRINNANKGGLIASMRGIPAFLPVSQLTPDHYPRVEGGDKKKILKKLKNFIGKTLSVKIINFNPEEEKVIISEKRAWEEIQKEKLKSFKIGTKVTGSIKTVTSFGAFITFDKNLEGLIHISEYPAPATEDEEPAPEVAEGDTVEAKIIDIKGTKVFLSLRK